MTEFQSTLVENLLLDDDLDGLTLREVKGIIFALNRTFDDVAEVEEEGEDLQKYIL